MSEKTQIRATAAPWHGGVELLVRQGDAFGVEVVMKIKEKGLLIDPTMRLGRDEAQVLMDDLWDSGFRPTEGSGSAGSLKATERHLDDMRTIAFKKLNIGS